MFGKPFRSRWGLGQYTNPDAPAIFIGLYRDEDIRAFENHRGFKAVMFCGQDVRNARLATDCIIITGSNMYSIIEQQVPVQDKRIVLPMRSFDHLKPVPLGDKVYIYMGSGTSSGNHFSPDIVEQLEQHFGIDTIIRGVQGKPLEYVIDNYYRQAAVNVQMNPTGGFTTAVEMAYLGRWTLGNSNARFCKPWDTVAQLISLIELELSKAGIVQHQTRQLAKAHFHQSPDWLQVDFWK